MDHEQAFTTLLALARRNLPYADSTRQASLDAIDEMHSALAQRHFFAFLDAQGGKHALANRLEAALTQPPAHDA